MSLVYMSLVYYCIYIPVSPTYIVSLINGLREYRCSNVHGVRLLITSSIIIIIIILHPGLLHSLLHGDDVRRGRLYFEGNLLFTHGGEIESPEHTITDEDQQ